MDYTTFINVSNVAELKQVRVTTDAEKRHLKIGVNITLTDLAESLKSLKKDNTIKLYEHSLANSFLSQLKWFASTQIRNFATLAGNIVTGSPISDLNPVLVASNAWLTISSLKEG